MIIMLEMLSSEVVTSAAVHCKKPIIIPYTIYMEIDTTLLEYANYHK